MVKPFDNISEKNIRKLLKSLRCDPIILSENTVISKTIVDSKSICIIISGYIQIKNICGGNNIVIEELIENDVFNSSTSYIDSTDYEMITKEETKLVVIDEKRLMDFSDNSKQYYNQFIKNLFMIISEKTKLKNERIQIITKKSIRDKLLEYFAISRRKNGSVNIYLPFNFAAFADYLGINRSALMRELKNLKDEGFIKTKGNKIKLLY